MNLIWDEQNTEHIARHHVEPEEVEEAVSDPSAHIVRVKGSHARAGRVDQPRRKTRRYQVIGQTLSGRYLTVFVDDEPDGFYVVTAYDSSDGQIRLYWRHK